MLNKIVNKVTEEFKNIVTTNPDIIDEVKVEAVVTPSVASVSAEEEIAKIEQAATAVVQASLPVETSSTKAISTKVVYSTTSLEVFDVAIEKLGILKLEERKLFGSENPEPACIFSTKSYGHVMILEKDIAEAVKQLVTAKDIATAEVVYYTTTYIGHGQPDWVV